MIHQDLVMVVQLAHNLLLILQRLELNTWQMQFEIREFFIVKFETMKF